MQTEKNIWLRVLSMILTLALLISCIPNQVYAMAGEALASLLEREETEETIETPNETKRSVYEVTELREANVKHFALGDGTYTAVMYGSAVHTQDADGNWQDIDNRLAVSGGEFSTSNARIKFTKKITGNETLFTLHDGDRKITMSLNNAIKKTVGVVTNHTTEFDSKATQLQKLMTLDNLSSEILYADILDGVDLQYVVESLNVKENIIVKERKDSYQYTFTIALNNLEAEMAEDGSVRICDPSTKETVYNIPAGFMYDANGEYSTAVTYTLTNGGNGKYSLTVTADATWLNAENRVFPVVIDPTVTTGGGDSYEYTSIHSWMPDECGNTLSFLAAGTYGTAYWRVNSLPDLPAGYYVTNASLTATRSSAVGYPNSSYSMELGVYKVISEWDANTFCYSDYNTGTAGQFETYAIDAVSGENSDHQYVWNITDVVREWYNLPDSNMGVAIRATSSGSDDLLYRFTCGAIGNPLRITYKVIRGIEDYWSYATQNVGRAGTGYVNKATGELTFAIGTLATIDALFGHTTTLVYNQAYAGKYVVSATANVPNIGHTFGYGIKMNVNEYLVPKTYTNAEGKDITYYIWTDADGTEHDFYPEDENAFTYKDNDGLLLTLTVDNGTYEIKDMSHNVRIFKQTSSDRSKIKEGAILQSIRDKNGNVLRYTYTDWGRIGQVQVIPNGSTAIPQIQFLYNSHGQVKSIYYGRNDGPIVRCYYSPYYYETSDVSRDYKGFLKRLDFVNENQVVATASYEYDSSGKLIAAHDDTSGYSVRYTYSGNRVASVTEYAGVDDTQGQTIAFTYRNGYTEIRSSGSDDQYGTDDDIINAYVFDDYARVTSHYSMDVARTTIYGGSSTEYETQENIKNNIKASSVLGGAASNYIFNGGFQYLDKTGVAAVGWKMPNWGVVMESNTDPNNGNCVCFFVDEGTTETLSQRVYLEKGIYTLSANFAMADADGFEVYIKAKSLSVSGREFCQEIPVNRVSRVDIDTTYTLSFEADNTDENGGEYFEIIFELVCNKLGPSSEFCVANVMLEKNKNSNAYSMVEFGNFDNYHVATGGTAAHTLNQYWTMNNASVVNIDGLYGNVLNIDQTVDNIATASQTIYRANPSDIANFDETKSYTGQERKFIVAGMAKGTYQYASGDFRIEVQVEYMSGRETFNVDFYYGTNEWQFVSKLITTDDTKPIKSITLALVYKNNPGAVYFDNIYATQVLDNGTISRDYFPDGKIKKQENGYYWESYEYDEKNNLTRLENSRGEVYEYEYNEYDLLETETYAIITDPATETTSEKTWVKNYIDYEYNSCGQMISMISYNGDDPQTELVDKRTVRVSSFYTYDTTAGSRTYGVLLKEVDNLGYETKYIYDTANGWLLAALNLSTGKGTCYTYDILGNITSVMPATYIQNDEYEEEAEGSQVNYRYSATNRLETITTPSTTYKFIYDDFGNTDAVSVGNGEIVNYEYQENNGKLSAIHYGNGFTVHYVYDELENISKVCYSDGEATTDAYLYHYNAYGLLCRFENLLSGKGITYQYDSSRRLIGYAEFSLDDYSQDFSATILYNNQSQVSESLYQYEYIQNNTAGTYSGFLAYNYVYNEDGTLDNLQFQGEASGGEVSYKYDIFGRLERKSYAYTSGDHEFSGRTFYYFTTYNSPKKTSAQIQGYTSIVYGSSVTHYDFEYDRNGNIIKVSTEYGECRYSYDSLGQLLREDNTALNATYTYEYDAAGNILYKNVYELTAAWDEPTELVDSYTYGYGGDNPDWGDQLTSYNGDKTRYDTIGNPLQYSNGNRWSFTWEHGRRLAQAEGNGYTLSFTYNDEGIRTSKTVNGEEHRYILNGDQIVSEQWGQHLVLYLYDADGTPIGMQYHHNSYFHRQYDVYWFEKNLQGDIVAVYDKDGTKLISYAYDAWGNFTTTYHNDCTASDPANFNPYRYRSYYYDAETGFYYVSSRYYDPEIGRWINADGYVSTGQGVLGTNMFAYCGNNPVNRVDYTGQFWSEIWEFAKTAVTEIGKAMGLMSPAYAGCGGAAAVDGIRGEIEYRKDAIDTMAAEYNGYI